MTEVLASELTERRCEFKSRSNELLQVNLTVYEITIQNTNNKVTLYNELSQKLFFLARFARNIE